MSVCGLGRGVLQRCRVGVEAENWLAQPLA